MRIRIIQKLINIIRFKNYRVKNNKILFETDNRIVNMSFLNLFNKNCNIRGDNNIIIFRFNTLKFPKGLKINIHGNDNYIEIHQNHFKNSSIYIYSDKNKFVLKHAIKVIEGATFSLGYAAEIKIDEDCEIGNDELNIVARGFNGKSHKVFIGKGTHIAREAIIRNTDGEFILDKNNQVQYFAGDIHIGEHCWITSRCIILKSTYLPNNTIVGANSLVNKRFLEENTLIAGSPAKVIKNNTNWVESGL